MTDPEMTDEDVARMVAAGKARRTAGEQGEAPRALDADDEESAARSVDNATGADNAEDPAPGDVHGIGVTASRAAPGTSQEATALDGIRRPEDD